MKICLINPPTTSPEEESYFPMALLVLGGFLKQAGIACHVVDLDLLHRQNFRKNDEYFLKKMIKRLKKAKTDIFGITTICSNFPQAILLAKYIKKKLPRAKIILGGPQVSALPGETMETFPFIDFVVIGEGELTLVDLLKTDLEPSSVSTIKGLCYREGSLIKQNPPQKLIEDLDELPLPDYDLVDMKDYVETSKLAGKPFHVPVEAGRGCPFRCTFCSTNNMWARNFRVKSPARILKEMEYLHKKNGQTLFPLIHDNFTTSKQFIRDFTAYLLAHNRHRLRWTSSSRADCLDDEILMQMVKSGCQGLFFGIESGSMKVQKLMKKNIKLDRYEPLLKKLIASNVHVTTAFILGFPEETEDDINASILTGFAYKKWGASTVFFSQLAPLAGTEITLKNFDKLKLTAEQNNCTRNCVSILRGHARDLIKKHKKLFPSFYTAPTPHLPPISLEGMGLFYHRLFNNKLKFMEILLENKKITPLRLYQDWMIWLKRHFPHKLDYGGIYALDHFATFAFENYFKNEIFDDKNISFQNTALTVAYHRLEKIKNRLLRTGVPSSL